MVAEGSRRGPRLAGLAACPAQIHQPVQPTQSTHPTHPMQRLQPLQPTHPTQATQPATPAQASVSTLPATATPRNVAALPGDPYATGGNRGSRHHDAGGGQRRAGDATPPSVRVLPATATLLVVAVLSVTPVSPSACWPEVACRMRQVGYQRNGQEQVEALVSLLLEPVDRRLRQKLLGLLGSK